MKKTDSVLPSEANLPDNNLIGLISLILGCVEKCESKPLLIHQILSIIINKVNCEIVTLRLGRDDDLERYQASLNHSGLYVSQFIGSDNHPAPRGQGGSGPCLLPNGFWPTETWVWPDGGPQVETEDPEHDLSEWYPSGWSGRAIKSIIAIPFTHNKNIDGLLVLGFSRSDRRAIEGMRGWYRHLASFVGLTLTNWHALAALRERVKELSCLHGIARLLEPPYRTIEEVLQGVVELLPQAWLYAQEASARIEYNGQAFISQQKKNDRHRQSAVLMVNGKEVGEVAVSYATEKPDLDEGPFLAEERKLLDNVARQVAQYIERRLYEAEKAEIMDKLRHADRLAMIGYLAASLAHEINEPLTSILGYAQLAAKSPELPPQLSKDIGKVVATSLHVREVIRKTLLYSRKIPSKPSRMDLNPAVRESLDLFKWRCHKEGITSTFEPSEHALEIVADPGQIRQVINNLIVNAIQATPNGGLLKLRTKGDRKWIYLTVFDSGQGMTKEVVDKMFIPFFTTKEAGRGTGLGLSVVHGIVTEHGGVVNVKSRPGQGTEIEVRFPRSSGETDLKIGVDGVEQT